MALMPSVLSSAICSKSSALAIKRGAIPSWSATCFSNTRSKSNTATDGFLLGGSGSFGQSSFGVFAARFNTLIISGINLPPPPPGKPLIRPKASGDEGFAMAMANNVSSLISRVLGMSRRWASCSRHAARCLMRFNASGLLPLCLIFRHASSGLT